MRRLLIWWLDERSPSGRSMTHLLKVVRMAIILVLFWGVLGDWLVFFGEREKRKERKKK